MQNFLDAAHAVLADLHERVGLEAWWLARRRDDDLVILASVGDYLGRRPGTSVTWQDSFSAAMIEGGAPAAAARITDVPAYAALAARGGFEIGAVLVVPVRDYHGNMLGTICGAGRSEHPGLEKREGEVVLASGLLGALLAQELLLDQETRRAESAERLSLTDGLTKLGNRVAWDTALSSEEARATRYASAASVLVLDLNDLKQINDGQGHEAGDQRLCQVAQVLTEQVRPCDVVARLGGDEFGVLLPETDLAGAGELRERLRATLGARGLSVAVGVAGRGRTGGVADAWLRADAAMYRDKRSWATLAPDARIALDGSGPGSGPDAGSGEGNNVDALLTLVRRQLRADVAFISTFSGADRSFRNISTDIEVPFSVGLVEPLAGTYCELIAVGEVPEVVPDTRDSVVADLPGTRELNIGSHIGIALHGSDGQLYGSLCAFSQRSDPTLVDRDAEVLRSAQSLLMRLVEAEDRSIAERHRVLREVELLGRVGGPEIVFQPIVGLGTMQVIGYEALSRFPMGSGSPAEWYERASAAGVGPSLELAAIGNATRLLSRVDGCMTLNVSPETACLPAFTDVIRELPMDRLVIEITEHAQVEDYTSLQACLQPLRRDGLRVAVDDTGAGFASMRHVLALLPDYIKLDLSLTRGIDQDPARQALAASLWSFATATGSDVIAEGVETAEELATLTSLGIGYAQGYHLGRPAPVNPSLGLVKCKVAS